MAVQVGSDGGIKRNSCPYLIVSLAYVSTGSPRSSADTDLGMSDDCTRMPQDHNSQPHVGRVEGHVQTRTYMCATCTPDLQEVQVQPTRQRGVESNVWSDLHPT